MQDNWNGKTYVQVNYKPANQPSTFATNRAAYLQASKIGASKRTIRPPRGSLSSCSSSSPELSGAETELEPSDCVFRYDEDVFERSKQPQQQNFKQVAPIDEAKQRLTQQRGNLQARNVVHSRSVSLIVNPNFAADSDDAFETPADQQRQRQSFVKKRPLHRAKQLSRERLHNETISSLKVKPMGQEASSLHTCESGHTATDPIAPNKLLEGQTEANLQEPDEKEEAFERFRHLGFLLRQISDEFAR